MALIVSDSFTGPGGQTLQAYNANWVKVSGHTGDMTHNSAGAILTGAGANAAYYRSDAAPSSADYSVSADVFNDAGVPGVIGRCSTSAGTFYSARIAVNTAQLYKFVGGAATLLSSAATGLTGAQTYNVRMEMIGNSIKVYVNGSSTALLSVSDAAISAAGKPGVRQTTGTPAGTIDNFSAEDTTSTEVKTLTAETGSFALAAPATGARANRVLRAGAGAFGISVSESLVIANRHLVGGAGVFVLTGGSGDLKASRALAAGVGVFALSAAATGLLTSRAIQAECASFAVEAPLVDLVYVPVGAPGGPTYTLEGAVGVFDAATTPVLLRALRRMPLQAQAFAFAGGGAGMLAARRLVAAPAPFAWQGFDANLYGTRRMGAGPGVFALSGTLVDFQASGVPEPTTIDAETVPGHIVFSGYQRRIAFHGGSRVVVFEGNNNRVRF